MEGCRDKPIRANRLMRTICIGAGSSGLYLAYKLKTSFKSMSKWDGSASYASAQEIHSYFSEFADNHGLREFIKCGHCVVGANWDDVNSQWLVRVENPRKEVLEKNSDFLINATGYLNPWWWPSIPGLESFNGELVHTADWGESLVLTGKSVGLIGIGSSGIQLLPQLQRTAVYVTAFIADQLG
ncbi:hypothetical protein BBP40_009391 [Aspergillus hancockii]|nr:hypothetical protein BBP40_009391 [Aspergillus hancockii]